MTAAGPQDTASQTERCFFLLLGAPESQECRDALEREIAAGRMPWEIFIRDGAAPYFLDRLRKANLEDCLPREIGDRLNLALLEQTGRNIVMLRELESAVAAMNARGIEPVLLKGAALIHQVYTHPGFRRLADIDLLVRKNEMTTAGDALSSIGYKFAGRRGHHSNFSAQKEFPVAIELHHDLFNNENPLQRLAFPLVTEDFIDRSAAIEFEGRRARSFIPEDQLLYLACHAAKERFGSLKLLVDIYELIKKEKINWHDIFSRADYYNISMKVYNIVFAFEKYKINGMEIINRQERNKNISKIAAKWIFGERGRKRKADVFFYNIGNIEGWRPKCEALLALPWYMLRGMFGSGVR